MIQLQKEYAENLLCHVNPYTGVALIDDPAVMTIQINNEDSAIKWAMGADEGEQMKPYRDEVQKRFNHFLLMKYHTREQMKEAWTSQTGCCALGEDEDPVNGTVRGITGGFYQPTNNPNGQWDAEESPARYADFMEFGILMNRKFYQDMKDYLHSLGAKVPIVTSNLIAGAAHVYGHTDGDLMENNCYFNHPLLLPDMGKFLYGKRARRICLHKSADLAKRCGSYGNDTFEPGFGGDCKRQAVYDQRVERVRGTSFPFNSFGPYGCIRLSE